MFRQSSTPKVTENALSAIALAGQLARDKKFRKRLLSALEHTSEAGRRARRGHGLAGTARQLARDQALQTELRHARRDLQRAYARLNAKSKRQGHRLRRLTFLTGLASLAAVPQVRARVSGLVAIASRNTGHPQRLAEADGVAGTEARPHTLDALTKEELYARAQEAEIPGRSEMSKDELIAALRAKG
jgi:hypothetical protein